MNKLAIIRILIIISPFFLPWWICLIFAISGLFYFDNYYEIILIGIIFDVLYFSNNTFFGILGFTIISCVLFILIKQIKQRLILY